MSVELPNPALEPTALRAQSAAAQRETLYGRFQALRDGKERDRDGQPDVLAWDEGVRWMNVRRIVPDIKSQRLPESRAFYVDFLGLEIAMDLGFIMTFVSPNNPTAQISVMRDDGRSTPLLNVSVEGGGR